MIEYKVVIIRSTNNNKEEVITFEIPEKESFIEYIWDRYGMNTYIKEVL